MNAATLNTLKDIASNLDKELIVVTHAVAHGEVKPVYSAKYGRGMTHLYDPQAVTDAVERYEAAQAEEARLKAEQDAAEAKRLAEEQRLAQEAKYASAQPPKLVATQPDPRIDAIAKQLKAIQDDMIDVHNAAVDEGKAVDLLIEQNKRIFKTLSTVETSLADVQRAMTLQTNEMARLIAAAQAIVDAGKKPSVIELPIKPPVAAPKPAPAPVAAPAPAPVVAPPPSPAPAAVVKDKSLPSKAAIRVPKTPPLSPLVAGAFSQFQADLDAREAAKEAAAANVTAAVTTETTAEGEEVTAEEGELPSLPRVRPLLKRVVIAGILPKQVRDIDREFNNRFDLEYYSPSEAHGVGFMSKVDNAYAVAIFTNLCKHVGPNIGSKSSVKRLFIKGSVSSLKTALTQLYLETMLPAEA